MFRQAAKKVLATSIRTKYTLPDLAYDYGALEPHINAHIMELHHSKHHQTYINNINMIEEQMHEAVEKGDHDKQLSLIPGMNFNYGGYVNHCIFWKNMCPNGGGEPNGEIAEAINKDFGSFDNLKAKLSAATVGVQGSGWGWLGYNKDHGKLCVATTSNQDLLTRVHNLEPIFGIDVWEHAYYLQYKNVRPDYVKSIWNVVNWNDLNQRFANARS